MPTKLTEERRTLLLATIVVLGLVLLMLLLPHKSYAHDRNSPLHDWFEGLHNQINGNCCAEADGRPVDDDAWTIQGRHYAVKIDGHWEIIPDDKLVTESNKFGKAVLWMVHTDGKPVVRCFLPGQLY